MLLFVLASAYHLWHVVVVRITPFPPTNDLPGLSNRMLGSLFYCLAGCLLPPFLPLARLKAVVVGYIAYIA